MEIRSAAWRMPTVSYGKGVGGVQGSEIVKTDILSHMNPFFFYQFIHLDVCVLLLQMKASDWLHNILCLAKPPHQSPQVFYVTRDKTAHSFTRDSKWTCCKVTRMSQNISVPTTFLPDIECHYFLNYTALYFSLESNYDQKMMILFWNWTQLYCDS